MVSPRIQMARIIVHKAHKLFDGDEMLPHVMNFDGGGGYDHQLFLFILCEMCITRPQSGLPPSGWWGLPVKSPLARRGNYYLGNY